MIQIRRSSERGHADHGWLDTYHTFSFADYQDPNHMGYRSLRVINEDFVQPGQGFGTHGHRDMEIITVVLEGTLEHKDSMDNGTLIRPGEVQRMTAGTGVTHSEFNPSKTERVHLLQIWILPEATRLKPGYEQKAFQISERKNRLCLVGTRSPRQGALKIHQDAELFVSTLEAGQTIKYNLNSERFAWIQIARGSVLVNGHLLGAGDGVSIHKEAIDIAAKKDAEILLFDLA